MTEYTYRPKRKELKRQRNDLAKALHEVLKLILETENLSPQDVLRLHRPSYDALYMHQAFGVSSIAVELGLDDVHVVTLHGNPTDPHWGGGGQQNQDLKSQDSPQVFSNPVNHMVDFTLSLYVTTEKAFAEDDEGIPLADLTEAIVMKLAKSLIGTLSPDPLVRVNDIELNGGNWSDD